MLRRSNSREFFFHQLLDRGRVGPYKEKSDFSYSYRASFQLSTCGFWIRAPSSQILQSLKRLVSDQTSSTYPQHDIVFTNIYDDGLVLHQLKTGEHSTYNSYNCKQLRSAGT